MKESKPLVSVRIVTFNQENYIVDCIESVLAQTYKNIELIISDDGSTDSTQKILEDYKEKYKSKIKLKLSKSNEGITKNINSGLENCSGKYIAGLGGDDILLPTKIEEQVNYMEKNKNCSICFHDLDVFDSDTNKTIYLYSEKKKPKNGTYKTLLKNPGMNGACSNLIKGDILKKIKFDESLPVAADYFCWVSVLLEGGEIHYIDKVLARYRMHSDNVSTQKDYLSQNNLDHLITYQKIISKKPNEIRHIFTSYSRYLLSIRKQTDYLFCCWINIYFNFSLKALVGITTYVLTFGRVKL